MFRAMGWVGSLLVVSAVWGAGETEVTVNGQAISRAEVDAAFARTSVARQPLTEEQRLVYRDHVVNLLIDGILLKQFLMVEASKPNRARLRSIWRILKRLCKRRESRLIRF